MVEVFSFDCGMVGYIYLSKLIIPQKSDLKEKKGSIEIYLLNLVKKIQRDH